MNEVFVSYSRTDLEPVCKIAGQLERRGYGVWWDQRLRGGQDFGLEIELALKRSNCAVVAWSSTARNSLWVRAEAMVAWEAAKIVQLSLDGATPPLPFNALHLIDFSLWRGNEAEPSFIQLARSVEGVLQGGEPPAAAQVPQPKYLAGFSPVAAVGGASLALVILAAGFVGLGTSGVLSADAFGLASGTMLLVAMLAFGYMLTRVIATYLASRQ